MRAFPVDLMHAYIGGMDDTDLIGRQSTVVPGRFGEPLKVERAYQSWQSNPHDAHNRQGAHDAGPQSDDPLFLCLHGWGSNEHDFDEIMHAVAPECGYVSLRAPLTLQQGAYSWFHDSVPTGADLDRDAFAAAQAIDAWVSQHIPEHTPVAVIGFSQGGLLAIHLLRVHPERYRAALSLSGFLAPGLVPGAAPADDRVKGLAIPTFYGHGSFDTVIPHSQSHEFVSWLREHTDLTDREYHGMGHSISMKELDDAQTWLEGHGLYA